MRNVWCVFELKAYLRVQRLNVLCKCMLYLFVEYLVLHIRVQEPSVKSRPSRPKSWLQANERVCNCFVPMNLSRILVNEMRNRDRACEREKSLCVCKCVRMLLAMYASIWISLCIIIVFYTFVLFYISLFFYLLNSRGYYAPNDSMWLNHRYL